MYDVERIGEPGDEGKLWPHIQTSTALAIAIKKQNLSTTSQLMARYI